jgi:hypothetical protein
VEKMPLYSRIQIASEPLISIDDIVSYDWATHDIVLTAEAYDKLAQLKVPMEGKSFIVCVNKTPVYWGAFWSLLSAAIFEGASIGVPYSIESRNAQNTITIGYFSGGTVREDPRSNTVIKEALQKAGKLKD